MIHCHGCGEWMLKDQALRKNAKAAGKTVVAYDVVCPHCYTQIGRVLWGKYIPEKQPEGEAALPPGKPRSGRERRHTERRRTDRRSADRRRTINKGGLILTPVGQRYLGPERRTAERRKDERRRDERRSGDRRKEG